MVNCSLKAFIKIVKPLLLLFSCLVEEAQRGRSMDVGTEEKSVRHVAKCLDLNKLCSCKCGRKKRKH